MRNFKNILFFLQNRLWLKIEKKDEQINKKTNLSNSTNNDMTDLSDPKNKQNHDGFDTYLNVKPWG